MEWLSSYMLHPPVTQISSGFLQSRDLPLDICTPPVLMFVKLSQAKTNSDLSLPAMELSISTGTCAAKESLKWQFCLPAKTGQLVRKEQCWQAAEVAVEFFWKLCYVGEWSCKGSVPVRVGWGGTLLAKSRVIEDTTLGYPWTQQWHGLSQLAVEIRDRGCQDPGAVPLLMSSRLPTLMPSARAHMLSVEGKDWKMLQLLRWEGLEACQVWLVHFPWWCFPVVSHWRIRCRVQQITCSVAQVATAPVCKWHSAAAQSPAPGAAFLATAKLLGLFCVLEEEQAAVARVGSMNKGTVFWKGFTGSKYREFCCAEALNFNCKAFMTMRLKINL